MIQFSTSITIPDSIDCLRRQSLAYINVRPGNSKQFRSIVLLVSEEQGRQEGQLGSSKVE